MLAGLIICFAWLGSIIGLAQTAQPLLKTGPELTNAQQVLHLSLPDGTDKKLAKLKGIVTYADPAWEIWFMKDATGGLFIDRETNSPELVPGMEVEIEGEARPAGFAPILIERHATITGTRPLPPADLFSFDQLAGGREDSQWIELDAVVRGVITDLGHLFLYFSTPNTIKGIVPGFAGQPPPEALRLVDARVRVRGVCATRFNKAGNLLDYLLYIPNLEAIRVVEPPPAAPFDLPLQPLTAPMRYDNAHRFGHRIKVSGVMTARISPTEFFMQDDSGGAYIQTREPTQFTPGDRLEAVVFPEPAGATPSMMDALVRLKSHGPLPTPLKIDPSGAIVIEWDCVLVTVESELVEKVRGSTETKLIIRSGDRLWEARYANPEIEAALKSARQGARLALTGICAIDLDDQRGPLDLHITIRSPNDVRILKQGPWWTAEHALALLAAATLLLLIWRTHGLWQETRLKEQYRLVFENTTDLVSTQDLDGRFTSANNAWKTVTGFPLAKFRGEHFEEILAPGQASQWRQWWRRVRSGDVTPPKELEIVGVDGRRIWLEVCSLLIEDTRGQVCVESIGRDITNRRRSEQLRASQQKTLELIATGAPLPEILGHLIRSIEEQSPGVIGSVLLLDSDGITLRHAAAPGLPEAYNRAIDGTKAGEGVGSCGTAVSRRAQVIVTDISSDPLWASYQRLATTYGLRACWSTPIFSKTSRILGTFALYYREPRAPSSEDIDLINAAGSMASIAIERKLADEALQHLNMLQKAVLDAASFSIISAGTDGKILSFNRAAEQMLGYTAAEAVEQMTLEQFHDGEEIAARARTLTAELGQPIAPGFEVFAAKARYNQPDEQEWTYIRKDGQRLPVQVSVTAMADDTGRPAGFLCVGADLTERKKDELLRTELEARLRQSEKMQAIGTLAGGIAHDFNNILGAILGNAEVLKMDLPSHSDLQESLAGILKASERARLLVLHILAFSRSEVPERHLMPLGPIVTEALSLIRASLPSTVEIHTTLAATPLQVRVNATQIHQVLMNLCSNASHAMQGSFGRIDLEETVVQIDAAAARSQPQLREGRYIMLSIADNGHGMESKMIERIFEPFFTTKGPGEGTGLGLAVVHGIMQSHEGAITVASSPGQGSVFHLYFPAVEVDTPPAAPTPETLPRGSGQRILIVDDEAAIVRLAAKQLVRLNYIATALADSAEAWASFQAAPDAFDLVVTDLTMPHLTGTDLAKRMLALRPGLPIILCTGHRSVEQVEEFKRLGIRQVLSKPFRIEMLAQALHAALGKTGASATKNTSESQRPAC